MYARASWTLTAGLLTFLWAPAGAQEPPSFPSEVELITVDAVVVDKDGRPVPGLTKDDFVVEEDGQALEIASFEASVTHFPVAPAAPDAPAVAPPSPEERPTVRRFAVVVDDANLPPASVKDIARALEAFVKKELRDGDEATLWTTTGDLWWSTSLPEGRDDLLTMFERLKGRGLTPGLLPDFMSDYEAFQIANYETDSEGRLIQRVVDRWFRTNVCPDLGGRQLRDSCAASVKARAAVVNGDRQRRTRLILETIQRATAAMGSIRGRKSLLLFAGGFFSDPDVDARDVAAVAREANTAIYFLDAQGLQVTPGLPTSADAGAPALDSSNFGVMAFEGGVVASMGAMALAEETGGFGLRNTNNLAGGASRVAAEAGAFYLLGFHPPEGKRADAWRKLKVSVKRKGLEVRARRGYVLRSTTTASKKDDKGSPMAARAVDTAHEITEIPVRAMVYALEPTEKDATRVLVAAELDTARVTFEGSGKSRVAKLELRVLATHRDTGRATGASTKIEVRLAENETPGWRGTTQMLELPPGVSQVRVVVHDPVTRRVGAVSKRLEVPFPGGLHLSTPLFTNVIGPSTGGRPPEPAITAHRVFPPEGLMYCRLEVFGAKRESNAPPRVAVGLEVRVASSGRVVREAAPARVATGADGRVVRLLGIGIGDLPEGAYDLVLRVKDEVSGESLEQREPFTLARETAAF
jgi:VWFA-related protein